MTLLELGVADLALIERARLALEPGFNVLTGETGAGKSLLIDALALVLGGRADLSLVRAGAERARVEALFDRLPEPLICVRELHAAGRSVARVDEAAVSAAHLATVAGPLVEIHGQHEQQRLLDTGHQRDLLDAYGGHGELRERTRAAVGALRENRAALQALVTDPREAARRLELLDHEASEIEAAALRPGEAEEIRAMLAAAAGAAQVARLVGVVHDRLAGDRGARDTLARAAREAADLARLDPRFAAVAARVEGLVAEAEEAAADLRRVAGEVEFDPAVVAALETRLGQVYALERKYGPDEAAVLDHARAARAEADRLRGLDAERIARLDDDVRLEADAMRGAAELGAARREAAGRLGRAVDAMLAELGLAKAHFDVAVSDAELGPVGADAVAFLIAPNPGEPAMPLAQIASGGELSRVSLAIKRVLAAADDTPTLVFDEIDAGIGGRSADPVGRSLWLLAREHQVVCVTHLPQIAAYADAHFQISKRERDGRTVTEIERLDEAGRLRELALMLAGSDRSETSLAGARELRSRAAAARDGRTSG